MKGRNMVFLILTPALCVLAAWSATSSCKCDVEVGISDLMHKSVSIGFAAPTIIPITEASGATIGFGITIGWGATQTVKQKCMCYSYCCPNKQAVEPFVYMEPPVVFEVETEPDPLIPLMPRWEPREVKPVPEPEGPPIWTCPGCQEDPSPEICIGTWEQLYSWAGAYISLGIGIHAGPFSVSLPVLQSRGSTLWVAPSSCLERGNRKPQFVDWPKEICLGVNQKKTLTFVVYDPDGPDDILEVLPLDSPAWLKVNRSQSKKIQWRPPEGGATLPAKQFTLDIQVEESYWEKPLSSLDFVVVDRGGKMGLTTVPFEVIRPVEIWKENEKEYWQRKRTEKGEEVEVLVQGFELVIHDPNPHPYYGQRFTYCVTTKYGRGKLMVNDTSDVRCLTSVTSTARIKVWFIPDPDAQGKEDEIVVKVSHYRCGAIFVRNGFPVKVVVNLAPEISISPPELKGFLEETLTAKVIATDLDEGDRITTLTRVSGPGMLVLTDEEIEREELGKRHLEVDGSQVVRHPLATGRLPGQGRLDEHEA